MPTFQVRARYEVTLRDGETALATLDGGSVVASSGDAAREETERAIRAAFGTPLVITVRPVGA